MEMIPTTSLTRDVTKLALMAPLAVRGTGSTAPRFGFAYSPSVRNGRAHTLLGDGQTVIRGGFGMFYDVVFFNLLSVSETQYPRILNVTKFLPETQNLYPTLLPPTGAVKPVLNPLSPFFNASPGLRNPASLTYSLSIQREVKRDYILEVGYFGNHAYHQIMHSELNPSVLTQAQAAAVIQAGSISAIPGTQARRLNPAWGARSTYDVAGLEFLVRPKGADRRWNSGILLLPMFLRSTNRKKGGKDHRYFSVVENRRLAGDRTAAHSFVSGRDQ